MPPAGAERNRQAIEVEIEYLKNGQSRIETALDKQGDKLDSVVDALTSLVRMSEKHDALEGRVAAIEGRNREADKTVSRGNNFMFTTAVLAPIALAILGWLLSETLNLREVVSSHLAHHNAPK